MGYLKGGPFHTMGVEIKRGVFSAGVIREWGRGVTMTTCHSRVSHFRDKYFAGVELGNVGSVSENLDFSGADASTDRLKPTKQHDQRVFFGVSHVRGRKETR